MNDQVFQNWSESAAAWDKHRESRRAMFGPITAELSRDAGVPETPPTTPYALLDVASGPGDASLDLAESLGPNATVWCTDLVPDMVAIAQRSAIQRKIENVRFRECRAEDLPFESDFFDTVLCRFGIMFFKDPVQGVKEALRVLRPGGRVGYCVWGTRAANPYHHVLQDVLDRYVSGPPPDPDAPGAYRFAPSGKLAALMAQTEAVDIQERTFRFNVEAELSFDQLFEARSEMSDSLRDKLRKMPPEQIAAFKEDVRKNSQPYFTATGVRFPAEVLIVSGQKRLG